MGMPAWHEAMSQFTVEPHWTRHSAPASQSISSQLLVARPPGAGRQSISHRVPAPVQVPRTLLSPRASKVQSAPPLQEKSRLLFSSTASTVHSAPAPAQPTSQAPAQT
jgi:hypothetical protein